MFIQTELTPNPETVKFIPGIPVMGAAPSVDFRAGDDVAASPLARAIFDVGGVTGVFLGTDYISVTKTPAATWDALKPLILIAVMDHALSGRPVCTATPAAKNKNATSMDDAITAQIVELIEARVRPAVAADGGDIVFDRFEGGIVYVHMHGACAGCPSSTITLKNGIENMLRHYIPEVVEVRAAGAGF